MLRNRFILQSVLGDPLTDGHHRFKDPSLEEDRILHSNHDIGMHLLPDARNIQKGCGRNFFHIFLEGVDAFSKIDGVSYIHGEDQ